MSSLRILVIGRGGREHALACALLRSPRVERVWCAPGNAGMERMDERVTCVPIDELAFAALNAFATEHQVDLAVVGPEVPLFAGVVDELEAAGITVFGPSARAAAIEGSKVFAKELCLAYGIPTAAYAAFDDYEAAEAYIDTQGAPCVIKADGLAAGKGVTVAGTRAEARAALREAMLERRFGAAGDRVVIEEYLEGEELSLLAFVDGEVVRPMVPAQDHKRAYDGDTGPNTGGMGAYSPVPHISADVVDMATETILKPAAAAMVREGRPFRGVLYAGLMLTDDGPKTIEFNCRFGDPETQVVLPRLVSDLADIMLAVARGNGELADVEIAWSEQAAVCVVLASGGYPGAYRKGLPIGGLDDVRDSLVFHAGTDAVDGHVVTAGGRLLGVTGVGSDLEHARAKAYGDVERISFEGMHFRTDIGHRAIPHEGNGDG